MKIFKVMKKKKEFKKKNIFPGGIRTDALTKFSDIMDFC